MNERTIPILDLFSGIGGFALAAEIASAMADAKRVGLHQQENEPIMERQGGGQLHPSKRRLDGGTLRYKPIAHAEIEPFACAVYHRHFPDSVCFGGVENITRDSVFERCGQLPVVVTGGFPCQPHSLAGKRKASADERDLWGECKRILGELRPRFALFENVGGLLTSERGLFYNRVLSDLAEIRFACLWQVVSAAEVGAPHRRERVWLLCVDELADSEQPGLQGHAGNESDRNQPGRERATEDRPACAGDVCVWPSLAGHWPSRPGQPQFGWEPPRVVGNTAHHHGRPGERGEETGTRAHELGRRGFAESGGGQAEPAMGILPDGIPAALGGTWPEVQNRNAQLKGYGNAIVPQVAAIFLNAIRKQLTP
jgi:hypothetical protein